LKLKKKYIITYDLTKLKPSIRVRFVYLLKGRNGNKGIIEELKGEFLANGCFILNEKNLDEIKEIFMKWNVKYKTKEVYLTY
jgi:hypothetical protein